ncbi:hypothetical protein DSM3645_02698 [Blastopirellula marina DSM 3645]|uniref:Uncharacterized protein n=1 Tax=Blastopirellula marina DSM 3645 TaxID=314230 RepID=A3ZVK3_9BACT|nr:hypothetical protein DSM3645_02698 [Blastopirellula marina DSM 3645]
MRKYDLSCSQLGRVSALPFFSCAGRGTVISRS